MRRFSTYVALVLALSGTPFSSAQQAPSETKRRERPSGESRKERGDRGERGDRSGFRRPRGGASSAAEGEGNGNYELRGFFGSGQNTEISLRQSGTDKAYWIRIGESQKDIYVEKVDPVAGTAVIVTHGTRYRLRLAAEAPLSARPVDTPAAPPAEATPAVTVATPIVITENSAPPATPPAAPPPEQQQKTTAN